MSCFIVPGASALIAGGVSARHHKGAATWGRLACCEGFVFALSLVEHCVNGEVTSTWPYLTAVAAEHSASVILKEWATEGVCLALVGLALWSVWSLALVRFRKNRSPQVRAS